MAKPNSPGTVVPARQAWVAGSCRPLNPGGIGTYGFAVRNGERLLVRDGGRVPDLPGRPMTDDVAEAFGLVLLLDWLREHPGPARIGCVSKAVALNARGEWEATLPALKALQDKARELRPADARVLHLGRTKCAEADAIARLAYVDAMQADPRLALRFASHLATPFQLDEARKAGARVHAFMGADEAERLQREAERRSRKS
ncbi:MAG: hypothetical protein AABY18_03800 [Candidatus Thermoplasmatota archaeon]